MSARCQAENLKRIPEQSRNLQGVRNKMLENWSRGPNRDTGRCVCATQEQRVLPRFIRQRAVHLPRACALTRLAVHAAISHSRTKDLQYPRRSLLLSQQQLAIGLHYLTLTSCFNIYTHSAAGIHMHPAIGYKEFIITPYYITSWNASGVMDGEVVKKK